MKEYGENKWIEGMFSTQQLSRYSKLLDISSGSYALKICEELSELQTAFLHHIDGKAPPEAVVEEVADVIIQLEKVMAYMIIDELSKGYDSYLFYIKLMTILEEKRKKLDMIIYTNPPEGPF